ncbi:hypothetical protein Haur_3254 [Herpetosiphon aurantiacus DSM 785]|uniref:Uncharacterized protein n=2 Tax=Herpetosiphon TaxID=64 RepID=A9B723_HERA2|nr:hypothetical protein Haur_3254 [Herpetosiphon aurantiacus DSM 785]
MRLKSRSRQMIKQRLTILGYGLIGLLIEFCYLFPSSEYRSAQSIPVYDPDTVLVIQWFVAGLIVPVSFLLVRAIRRRNQRFRWVKYGLLLVALALLSWHWFTLNSHSYPFPAALG